MEGEITCPLLEILSQDQILSSCLAHSSLICFILLVLFSWPNVNILFLSIFCGMRLGRGTDDAKNSRKYVENARKAITLEAAATAWSRGVPWALDIAEKAIEKGSAKPKRIAKAKAVRPKAKAKAPAR